jgi:two-component system cell cycle sensor histidine kinase/response regulator CckA
MRTILVVDDEPMMLTLVQSILEKRGFQVLSSTSPTAALSLFKSKQAQIRLLISDVVMAEMSGPAMASRMVALNPALPILFISAYLTREELAPVEPVARFAFLRKPFRPTALVEAVRQMLADKGQIA